MGKKKLPDMSNWTESQTAQFWDTHSPLDFEGEMDPADLVFERLPLKPIAVKLSEKDIQLLKRVAHAQGIGYTTIIRMWIKERLKQEVFV